MRVTVRMDRQAVLASWYDKILLLLALLFPTAAGLVYISWVALQRTRHALETLDTLRQETASRQRVEESLRQAQKLEAMGRLTGGVAHDFNNLLMVISTNLYLVKRLWPAVADSGKLAAIERAVTTGSNLTRQLLSFSRRQALQPEILKLQDRLPGMMDLVRPAVGARVQVSLEVDPALAAIEVDAAELELAVLNLAINARDAMPDGGQLQFRAARADIDAPAGLQGAFVVLSAHDTGQGIEPELLDKVFEPFFTTKAVGQGSGLGLSQVHGFCKRAGGTVALDSRPGQGTTVRLYFPAVQAWASAAPETPAEAPELLAGLRVLLVEDNPDVGAATEAVLEAMGCRVKRVADADQALAHLQTSASEQDLVLSDIVMPGTINGVELAARVRALWPQLDVLLMSGYSEHLELAASLKLEVLPKPCTPAVLAAALLRVRLSAAPSGPVATP
jgi:signal transduction histidine kinase/ActR/RegA family two-component response regulator